MTRLRWLGVGAGRFAILFEFGVIVGMLCSASSLTIQKRLNSEELEKAGTVNSKKTRRTEDKVPAVSTQGSQQVCLSQCQKT